MITHTIETYGPAPHNRNIWPSPTPTANQYKHMAQRRIIETYGHTIARRRSFVCASGRFFCLRWWLPCTHYLYSHHHHHHNPYSSMPVGVQCPISSSLGEFPTYWDWLWCPGLSPVLVSIALPFGFHTWCFPFVLTCHWISIVFLLYGRRIATHSVDPSLTHFLGEFPGLGLALVPDVVVPEADSGAHGAENSI